MVSKRTVWWAAAETLESWLAATTAPPVETHPFNQALPLSTHMLSRLAVESSRSRGCGSPMGADLSKAIEKGGPGQGVPGFSRVLQAEVWIKGVWMRNWMGCGPIFSPCSRGA